jgi:uncharacterized protein
MNEKIENKLTNIAQKRQIKTDPSHDFQHVLRVLNLAKKIGKSVNADLEILIPAALFHDTVIYRKDHPDSQKESDESADVAERILKRIKGYPKKKIKNVKTCIQQCSFRKAIIPTLLESKILQDADLLESTGAISIIRTFSSGGQMNRPFYNPKKPLSKKDEINFPSGVGLFYRRLLLVEQRIHTKLGKKLVKKRAAFLKKFLDQLKKELKESEII